MTTYRRFKDVLAEALQNPEVRAEWNRTALGREVSIWLLRYRHDHQLTQTKLAKLLGWKQPAVARLESGEHEPSFLTLQHLIDGLGARARIDIQPKGVSLRFLSRRGARHKTTAPPRAEVEAPSAIRLRSVRPKDQQVPDDDEAPSATRLKNVRPKDQQLPDD